MSRRKTKYTLRSDGLIMMTKTISGKRKAFYGHSDAEVESKYTEYMKSLETHPEKSVRTFKQVAEDWWEWKEALLSPNSVNSFKAKYKELTEEFNDTPITDITTVMMLQYLNKVAAQGYAQRGVSDRRSVAKQIFDYALAHEEITQNPCTQLPIVKGQKKKKRPPAAQADITKLEAIKTDSLISRLYYFIEYTGCRVGEASVLQQKHIDIDNHKATIEQNIAFNGQKPVVKPRTKTEAGMREVDLYDNVIDILPTYSDPNTYIFFPDGLPTKYQWEKALRTFEKENNFSSTPHQYRHTYAGIMHSAEVSPKDTMSRMGHSSIKITEDIYTEIEKQHNEKVRNKANKYIMEERLNKKSGACHHCGSEYTVADDGHKFTFCPDCGSKL